MLNKGDKAKVANYRPIFSFAQSQRFRRVLFSSYFREFPFFSFYTSIWICTRQINSSAAPFHLVSFFYHNSRFHIPTDSIYLDLTKAFDCIPHDKLLAKLWSVGMGVTLWKWVKCYLSGRSQLVSIDNTKFDVLPVTSRVPFNQGYYSFGKCSV